MRKWRRLCCISALPILFACNKYPQDNYPVECRCEQFSGIYNMYDPYESVAYTMEIWCVVTEESYSDSIYFENFANRFDFGYQLQQSEYHNSYIGDGFFFPLYDHEGNRWAFDNQGWWGADTLANRIDQDSLNINFTINNVAFYMEDGVPYYVCENCGHSGVKQH